MFAINQLDRQILSITLESIGQEFVLSDTQLGLLSGAVFALVYAIFGLPIAKLAATGNRRNIIAASIAVWSSLTVACAGAQNFVQLALARLGVGIGEAGGISPAHSIISDLYPPEQRTSAMATFVTGANAGILLAFLIGGIAGQALGWRWAFVIAGVPGLFLALILFLTVREPPRDKSAVAHTQEGSLLLATIATIWRDKGLFHALCGISLTGVLAFGGLAWTPTFIIRVMGLSQAQTGIFLALTVGLIAGIGTWYSGRIADRLGLRNPKWRLGVVIVSILVAKPFAFGFLLLGNPVFALMCYLPAAVTAGVFWGPTFAFLHSRVSVPMRPMATAIFIFAFNIVGVGVGPTVVGIASDTVFADYGARSLGLSLACLHVLGAWGAWHYWRAARTIEAKPTSAPAPA